MADTNTSAAITCIGPSTGQGSDSTCPSAATFRIGDGTVCDRHIEWALTTLDPGDSIRVHRLGGNDSGSAIARAIALGEDTGFDTDSGSPREADRG